MQLGIMYACKCLMQAGKGYRQNQMSNNAILYLYKLPELSHATVPIASWLEIILQWGIQPACRLEADTICSSLASNRMLYLGLVPGYRGCTLPGNKTREACY